MYNLNEVNLIGYVGQKPEIIKTNSEAKIAKFSVATSEKWKDKQGNEVKSTQWHNCSAFNALAGIIDQFVDVGTMVYVKGKLKYSKVEKQDEETRYYTDINVQDCIILKSKDGKKADTTEDVLDNKDSLKEQSEKLKNSETGAKPF